MCFKRHRIILNILRHSKSARVLISTVLLTLTFGLYASISAAQVEIVDRRPPQNDSSSSIQTDNAGSSKVNVDSTQLTEMFYQIQVLQQEVMELRGKVQEQEHHLKQLKQQRLDDYVDLDRRLGNAVSSTASHNSGLKPTSTSSEDTQTNTQDTEVITSSASPSEEIASYREAIDLVLKKKDYDKAATSFSNHLLEFPGGRYSGNAQYWLGEIYLQKNDLDGAKTWFSDLLSSSPNHTKALDAKFKLGKVYNLLGEKDKALELAKEVSNADGSTASLAKDYLKKHFSS